MIPSRTRRRLFLAGLILVAVFIVAAGGARPRYNRIVFGAVPLAAALVCFGVACAATKRLRSVAGGVAFWLSAAIVMAAWFTPSLAGGVRPDPRIERSHVLLTFERDRLRQALFAELQPVQLQNCQIERFGDEGADGGYLMCGNLLSTARVAYSYGIEGRDQWGCEVSERLRVPVHQYDCFDLRRPVCATGQTTFHSECVGPAPRTDEESRVFDSVSHQLVRNGDASKRVVIKMDVEGAEWESLAQTPDDVLDRTDQLVIELHGVGFEHQLAVVRRLKQFFHVAHVHFNNYACAERIDPFPASVYEVLFVNKRITVAVGPASRDPHPLDARNNPWDADCQTPTTRWSYILPAGRPFSQP